MGVREDAPGPGVDAIAALHFDDGGAAAISVRPAAHWPPVLEISVQPTPGVARDAAVDGPARLTRHTFELELVDGPRLAHYRERAARYAPPAG